MNARGAELKPVIHATDYLTGDAFTLRETKEGWWAIAPVPPELGRYYPASYYGECEGRFPGPVEWLQNWLYGRRAKWVTGKVGNAGRVLDVGCGPGHLLVRFRALGWTTVGTEVTEQSAAIPRQRHGLDVRAGELRTLQFPSEAFDAVVSWHTLEHMREPGEVLDECWRVLKPGGVLLVSVPDFSSLEARAQPSAWFHLDVPRHLVQFPAAVLRTHLQTRGFHIAEESFWTPEYDTFSLVQTWQNRMGLSQNLLYLVLKRGRVPEGTEVALWERLGATLLAIPMLPAAVLLAAWRSWRRTGAVVVMLARKRKLPGAE